MKNVISNFFVFAFGGYGWGWMYMTKNIALNKSNFVQTQVVMIKELTLICFKFFYNCLLNDKPSKYTQVRDISILE